MTALAFTDDQLLDQLRGLLEHVAGHGMHVSVRGDQLRAAIRRIDQPPAAVPAAPPPVPWQEPLSAVLRIVAEVVEDPAYIDLRGTNLVDALHAWATRNHTTISPAALVAVDRALSGE